MKLKIGEFEVLSFYKYETTVRVLLLRYKDGRDRSLAKPIMWRVKKKLKKYTRDKMVVVVPSRRDSQISRSFHHVEYLLDCAGIVSHSIFENKALHDQTNVSDRTDIANNIILVAYTKIKNKDVVVVDDIISSGSSLEACMRLVKPYVKSVKGISISYSKRFEK
ncbi:ComF family protein [Erysipelothrix anatis]|uniref:ComF family protein n=1 Tax=Erysipelothrix anatis TaxID=2683713 RepID=UPI00135BC841|nr:phosphoribosyltransferase family protein [Erysipelothrix anatis]